MWLICKPKIKSPPPVASQRPQLKSLKTRFQSNQLCPASGNILKLAWAESATFLWWLCLCDEREIISHGVAWQGSAERDRGPRKQQHGQTWDIIIPPSAEELPGLLAGCVIIGTFTLCCQFTKNQMMELIPKGNIVVSVHFKHELNKGYSKINETHKAKLWFWFALLAHWWYLFCMSEHW